MEYANNIQKNLLPPDGEIKKAFSDYSVIWKPRDIVSGDIYWMKRFDRGTVLCVCDCTGHGTSGALLSMLVVSAMEATVRPDNCHDTAETIWRLEQRLVDVFGGKTEGRNNAYILDGCDLAVLFISNNGSVTLSAGNTNVFVCDGREVQRFKRQRIFVGEGSLNNKDDVETVHISARSGNKFYIASDGLFDQPGGGGEDSRPFGYKAFEKIILDHHGETQNAVSVKIWADFEKHRGNEPRVDDFTLVTFRV
jgi:serine phosphatase RsbU (regulator of sigma subunit)